MQLYEAEDYIGKDREKRGAKTRRMYFWDFLAGCAARLSKC